MTGGMSTLIGVMGGLGMFLLGMAVLTDGLKALAGRTLRGLLVRATGGPGRGIVAGTAATLVVQSSSATTMTTIGLVSAGLLTFPQALGVVLGANIGTTGTGWLVALVGVRFSVDPFALPLVFVGALLRLLTRGRTAGLGSALAGFGLLLVGLGLLAQSMAGVAAHLSPGDLPGLASGSLSGILLLAGAGMVMTTLMQSSSAAVAATIAAVHAGAIAPEQAAALVIGQNIGTAVSSAVAAVGATTPAKRTALAHVVFNVATGAMVLAAFPLLAGPLARAGRAMDPAILLAAFHTLFNVLGVIIVLPFIRGFAGVVSRLVRQRGPDLTRHLDASVQTVPAVAVEAARRAVADVFLVACTESSAAAGGIADSRRDETLIASAAAAEEIRRFLSTLPQRPASRAEQARLHATLHALDHVSRLVAAARAPAMGPPAGDDPSAHDAASCLRELLAAGSALGAAIASGKPAPADAPRMKDDSTRLADVRRAHRARTMESASHGDLTPEEALTRTESVRILDRVGYHAWRASEHLRASCDESSAAPQVAESTASAV